MTSDPIQRILESQLAFQRRLYPDFDSMDEHQRADYVKDQILSLTSELHEALGEIGWKSWATSRHFNTDEFFEELIDALCFLMNLFLATGVPVDHLAIAICAGYSSKNARNIARQRADGYTGRRCPKCSTKYGDGGFCTPEGPATPAYCSREGSYIK